MPIYATDNGIERKPIPAGNYPARCTQMIEIGTVMGMYGAKKKVRLGWELPDELVTFSPEKGPQPQFISQEYSLSMNTRASLRIMLESWRGKGFTKEEAKKFEITKLLGVTCMINIIHKTSEDGSRVYASIGNISSIPKGLKVSKQVNPTIELSYANWDQDVFDALPEWLRAKMILTPEYAELKKPGSSNNVHEMVVEDDLPF